MGFCGLWDIWDFEPGFFALHNLHQNPNGRELSFNKYHSQIVYNNLQQIPGRSSNLQHGPDLQRDPHGTQILLNTFILVD